MNKILKIIIGIPNIPFILFISIYMVIMIFINTPKHEIMLIEDTTADETLRDHVNRIYPKHFRYFVAIIFYAQILIITLT